jgi:hypothetical protein
MSRKEELLITARLLRSQADAMSGRDAKQAFRKMADYYQREAEQRPPWHQLRFPYSSAVQGD